MAQMHRLITGDWIVLTDVRHIHPQRASLDSLCGLCLIMIDKKNLFVPFLHEDAAIRYGDELAALINAQT